MLISTSIINNLKSYAGIVFTAVFLSYWIAKASTYAPHDFANYYFASYFFIHGDFDFGILDPYTFNKRIFNAGFNNIFASFNPNPPSIALLFSPFALFPLGASKVAFNILSCFLFILTLHKLCKQLAIDRSKIFIFLPILFFVPIRNQVLFGQAYFLLFCLIGEGYLAYSKNRNILAVSLWSLAIMIKIFPAIIFLFLMLRKDWKNALFLGIGCLVIVFVSIFFQGLSIWFRFITEVLPRSSAGDLHSAFTAGTQSIHMLIKYCFHYDPIFNPLPPIGSVTAYYIVLSVWLSLVLSVAVRSIYQLPDTILTIGFLLLCSHLASPQNSTYSALLLLFVLLAVYGQEEKVISVILTFLVFLISNIPISLFHDSSFIIFVFIRLLLMVTLFIIFLWYFKIVPRLKIFIIVSLLLAGIKLWTHSLEKDSSERWIDTEYNSLIVDYEIKDGKIAYSSWTADGLKTTITHQEINKISSLGVSIKHNQIFYHDRQITDSSDNKKKALIVDGKYIIYLSDKGKGIGFYALRKLSIL